MGMLLFEAFIKFGSIGLLIAVGALIARDGRGTRALRYGLLLIAMMCSMFMTTGSPEITITGPMLAPLRVFDSFNTILIWWLGLSLFDDDFNVGKREWCVAALYGALAIPIRLHYLGFDVYWSYSMNVVVSGLSFSLMAHLCYKAVVGRKEDLVEQRRRIRLWFVIAVAMVVIMSVVAERLAGLIGAYEAETIWVTYILTMPIALWALLWLARLHPEVLIFDSKGAAEEAVTNIDERDKAAYQRLVDVMEAEKAYENHGLAIADLAERVGIPPHQLRKLINQTMGYRNFSSFLNKYRIADVKEALADPEKARVPVLTLALDAGFSSLAPFNRAFKISEGVTPTDFRAQSASKNNVKPVQN